jgi:hypothetical protein
VTASMTRIEGELIPFEGLASRGTQARVTLGLWRFARLASWIAGGVWLVGLIIVGVSLSGPQWARLLVFAIWLIAFVLAQRLRPSLVRWGLVKRWRQLGLPELLGYIIELRDDGLHFDSQMNRAVIFWPSIHELAQDKSAWVLGIPGDAIIIPKRLFLDVNAEQAFISEMLRRMTPVAVARSKEALHFTS